MSNNKKPIPHRVYNPSKEHPYVAGAVDIIDDRLSQNQQDVNAGFESAIAGLNDQNYVTVKATDEDTSIESIMTRAGVTPQKDTVYRVGFWDGEQYDESKYSEYAWNDATEEWKLLDVKEYTLATADDFIEPDAEKRAKVVPVGAAADVYGEYKENSEFVDVREDANGNLLEGNKRNGTKVIGGNLQVIGDHFSFNKVITSSIDNYEWLRLLLDAKGKILCGISHSGKLYADFALETSSEFMSVLNSVRKINNSIYETDNNEWADIKTDKDNFILEGITSKGIKKFYIPVDNGAAITKRINNPEWRNVEIDAKGNILSGRKADGTKVENCRIETDITQLLAYKKWHGKKIVCFGDSLTEMAYYVKYLEEFLGTTIYNRGASGRSVALGGQTHSFCERVTYPASNKIVDHHGGLPTEADLIILEGGTNDWALLKSQVLGDIKAPITEESKYTFASAYMFVLAKLKEKYPNAEIYTLNLHGIQSTSNSNWQEVNFNNPSNELGGFTYTKNNKNSTLEDYRKIIREASGFYGVKCIEMVNSKINFLCKENRELLSEDGLHPNDDGGYEMAKYIINNLNIF